MLIRVLIGFGIFLGIALIGVAEQIFTAIKRNKEREFLAKYNENFYKYIQNKDYESYNAMILEMNKAQSLLGYNGFASIRFPYENGYHSNVPILTLLLKIEEERNLTISEPALYIQYIQVAISRTIGDYNSQIESIRKSITNVLIDFYKGFNWLLSLPFIILSYLFTGNNLLISSGHRTIPIIVKVITTALQVVGTISGLMTIILGYNEFITILRSWFKF